MIYLLPVIAGALIVFVVILLIAKSDEANKKRLAELPSEIKGAKAEALRETGNCLDLSKAVALSEGLMKKTGIRQSSFRGMPDHANLLYKGQGRAKEALTKCRKLCSEGVRLSSSAQYAALAGFFGCAEAVCRECKPTAGRRSCPALVIIKKISIE